MNYKEENYEIINVRQSNDIIQSLGKTTLLSNKVFLTATLKIENRDGVPAQLKSYYDKLERITGTDFTHGLVAEFTNTEMRRIMESNSGSFYKNIEELMDPQSDKSLIRQWIILVKDKESGLYGSTQVITSTLYDKKEGKLFIKFSSEKKIKDILINYRNNYTTLNYTLMMKFKSVYTYKLYSLLMSRIGYQDSVLKKKFDSYVFTYNLSELKYQIGILDPNITPEVKNALMLPNPDYEKIENVVAKEKVLDRYPDLKRIVLDKAKNELEKSPLSEFIFDYNAIRSGRGGKVTEIELIMRRKCSIEQENKTPLTEEEKDAAICYLEEALKKYNLGYKDIKAIVVAAEYNIAKLEKACSYLENCNKDINNLVGFMIDAIKKDYKEPVKVKKSGKNSFNDFEQKQDYDMDEIEKFLTENN